MWIIYEWKSTTSGTHPVRGKDILIVPKQKALQYLPNVSPLTKYVRPIDFERTERRMIITAVFRIQADE